MFLLIVNMEFSLGKIVKFEYFRCLVLFGLVVFGIVGWVFFMLLLSSLLCFIVVVGVYVVFIRLCFVNGVI